MCLWHTVWSRGPDTLKAYICRYRIKEYSTDSVQLTLEDRTVLAMAISLFAVSVGVCHELQALDSDFIQMIDSGQRQSTVAPFQPCTQAMMLRQIARVLEYGDPDQSPTPSLQPVIQQDTPQIVLTRWGMVLPWCWGVWNDERLVDHNVIESFVCLPYCSLIFCFSCVMGDRRQLRCITSEDTIPDRKSVV